MGIEIAINRTPQETRVAVLENKVVTELYVDRAKKKDFVGNVYKGKVVKVLPGMQAAFVDIGLERAAFMHVSDLSVGTEPGDILVESDEDEKGPEFPRPRRQNRAAHSRVIGRKPGTRRPDFQRPDWNQGPPG